MAELSTDAAVGQGFDPIDEKQPSEALSHLSTGMFGIVENAPAMWVTVQIGPGVSAVRLRLPSGATDQMVPVNGVAVLAHTTLSPPPDGTVVEALDSSGKVIGSIDVTKDQEKPGAMYCAVVDGPVPVEGRPVPPTTR